MAPPRGGRRGLALALGLLAAPDASGAAARSVVVPLVASGVPRPSCEVQGLNCSASEELFGLPQRNDSGALSLAAKGTGSRKDIPLLDLANTQYLAIVGLGRPLRTARVLIDTGSADLWVWDSVAQVDSSPSASKVGGPVTITYGQGSVTGRVFRDVVDVGSVLLEGEHYLVPSESVGMGSIMADGVLGLALPGLSHTGKTILQRLREEAGVLAFCLLLTATTEGSYLVLGEPEKAWYSGDIAWAPVVSETWWLFEASFLLEGKKVIEAEFVLDSGTSYMMLPAGPVFVAFMMAVFPKGALNACQFLRESNSLVCPCGIIDEARTVNLRMGGANFPLRPADLLVPAGGGWCALQVMPTNVGLPPILGDTFLRTVLAVFDLEGRRVGLAKRTGKTPWPTPFLRPVWLLGVSLVGLPLAALACFAAVVRPLRWRQAGSEAHAFEHGSATPYQVL